MRSLSDDSRAVEWLQTHDYERLSKWEQGFVDDVAEMLSIGRGLTQRQGEKLDEIWGRYVGEGR